MVNARISLARDGTVLLVGYRTGWTLRQEQGVWTLRDQDGRPCDGLGGQGRPRTRREVVAVLETWSEQELMS